ncbi:MAG: hypothetical protein ACK55I_40530, partial [bacterium]
MANPPGAGRRGGERERLAQVVLFGVLHLDLGLDHRRAVPARPGQRGEPEEGPRLDEHGAR